MKNEHDHCSCYVQWRKCKWSAETWICDYLWLNSSFKSWLWVVFGNDWILFELVLIWGFSFDLCRGTCRYFGFRKLLLIGSQESLTQCYSRNSYEFFSNTNGWHAIIYCIYSTFWHVIVTVWCRFMISGRSSRSGPRRKRAICETYCRNGRKRTLQRMNVGMEPGYRWPRRSFASSLFSFFFFFKNNDFISSQWTTGSYRFESPACRLWGMLKDVRRCGEMLRGRLCRCLCVCVWGLVAVAVFSGRWCSPPETVVVVAVVAVAPLSVEPATQPKIRFLSLPATPHPSNEMHRTTDYCF